MARASGGGGYRRLARGHAALAFRAGGLERARVEFHERVAGFHFLSDLHENLFHDTGQV